MFNWEYYIALHKMEGNPSQRGVCVMGFLELRQERGVCSRVTAGMAIRNYTLFSEVRTPVYLRRTPQESKLVLKG